MEQEIEEWRDIEGFPDYQVSSFGRVKSKSRTIRANKGSFVSDERIMKLQVKKNKYVYVNLIADGNKNTRAVHRLVGYAFDPDSPFCGMEAGHRDGDKANNHKKNIQWCTPGFNTAHAFVNGLRPVGSKHANAKLNETIVKAIKRMLAFEFKPSLIAYLFDISKNKVHQIRRGEIWAHVEIDAAVERHPFQSTADRFGGTAGAAG